MQRLNRPGFIALRSGWLWAGSWRNIFRPSNISLVTWALYLPQFRFPRSGQTHGPLPRARTRRSAAQGTHPDTGGWRQRHLRESDPEDPEVFLSKDVEAKQPHIRSFVKRAVTFGVCPGREGARLASADWAGRRVCLSRTRGSQTDRRGPRIQDRRDLHRGCLRDAGQ